MNHNEIHQDPAFPAMTIDILNNMMSRSDNPGQLAEYLTDEIRELTGSRCVLLIQCRGNHHDVVHVNPTRMLGWAETSVAQPLYHLVHKFIDAQIWHLNEMPELAAAFPPDQHKRFALSVALPLRVGTLPVGAMLLLGLPEHGHHIETEIKLLNTLSSVLALVLRNAFLYEDQERIIEERTKELMLYGFTLDNMKDAVYWINPDGGFHTVNASACKMLDYTAEELAARSLMDICPFFSKESWPEHWNTLKNRGAMNFETLLRTKSGREIPVDISSNYFEFDGKAYSCAIARDITERKQAEERLQRAQKLGSIGTLAGGIAHDFNNMLFPIMGISEMLMEDFSEEGNEEAHNKVHEIYNAATRAADLVKQILSFSRLSEHKKSPIKIQRILKEITNLTRSSIPSNIKIDYHIQQDCPPVMADPTQMHQIIMNLITNAYHAVEESAGRIFVELKETQLPPEDAVARGIEPGGYAMLIVSDNGYGIDPINRNKIFEPYFTTKDIGKGTGLGLSVVYGIVKGHGGDIQVYSEIQKGSTFNVYIPLIKRTVQSARPPETTESNLGAGSERVLVVDDEASIVKLESIILTRLGYHVASFTNSDDALKAFKADPEAFDLVLSDMTMPEMTGVQLIEKMVAIRPDIPVVICTGFSEQISVEKAKDVGVHGFLTKPVTKEKMAAMIRNVLDKAK